MSISISGTSSTQSLWEEFQKLQQTKSQLENSTSTTSTSGDQVSFSQEGMQLAKMPPPPPMESINIEEMSDEDFSSFLEEMQEMHGGLPGIEEDTSVSDLTEDQLSQLRETFTDMMSQPPMGGPGGMGGMGGAEGMGGQGPMSVADMDDDQLISLLTEMQERTGSLPGLDEDVSVADLTEDQLTSIREAMLEHEQNRPQPDPRQMSAAAAYERVASGL